MKTTVALLVLFFLVLGGGYVYSNRSQVSVTPAYTVPADTATTTQSAPTTTPKPPATKPPTGGTTTPPPGTYTSAQVAAHNTSGSCWTSINGSVYNLTSWIAQHPGGQGAILSICGKDGTQAFEAQHGGGRDTRPQTILATFKIGTLAS